MGCSMPRSVASSLRRLLPRAVCMCSSCVFTTHPLPLSPLHYLQTKYRDAAERPPHQGVDGPRVSLFRSCACRHIQFLLGTPVRENAYGSHDHHAVLRRMLNTSAPRWFLAT